MKDCKEIADHISRLEGQLKSLKNKVTDASSCEDVVHITLSTSKSFDSLKAKLVEGILRQKFLKKQTASSNKELESLLKIIKS